MKNIRNRTVFLLDEENLAGGPEAELRTVRQGLEVLFSQVIAFRPGDQVIVGASHFAAKRWMFGLTDLPIQWRLGSGPDGAERAVLDAFDIDHYYGAGFNRLVIGSGDHAFAPVARRARELGMQVHLVTGRGWVSNALRIACPTHSRIREIPRFAMPRPLASVSSVVASAAA